MRQNSVFTSILLAVISLIITGCSSTKHVPEGKYLLDKVAIDITDTEDVNPSELYNYLRQQPNHKVLGFAKLQLATYSLSGRDTTKWYNQWIRKLGQAPIIYDPSLTDGSVAQLRRAMVNRGYMDATVTFDTIARSEKKKMEVRYHITAGEPHLISKVNYQIADSTINQIFHNDPKLPSIINEGDQFDRTTLDNFRGNVTNVMRNNGYYTFNKDDVSFIADTTARSKALELTMIVKKPRFNPATTTGNDSIYNRYYIGHVRFKVDVNHEEAIVSDTVSFNNIEIIYGSDHYLKPKALEECCYLQPGDLYSTDNVNRTYESLRRLSILKTVNIEISPIFSIDDDGMVNVDIIVNRTKKQGVSIELEGTNSEGDLGFGVGVTYQHRNLAKGSEMLTAKLRTSYESLSGNMDGLLHDRYSEYAAEVGITFPKFKAPFFSKAFKRKIKASTEFAVSFNYQERPEYTRIIAGAAWRYKWSNLQNNIRRTFDFIDINYVYLPHSTINFIDEIAPSNPLLRYSYEDHFIMRMGYTYYRTNLRPSSAFDFGRSQNNVYTLRASIETAGNFLYGMSHLFGDSREDGAYKVFGIQYSQYVKGDFDYAWTHKFDARQSLAFHGGVGIGFPYGNSKMIPFEKRFYAGGANGVRGWGVRALGPGNFDARNASSSFINQCGDIRLDLSLEYRAKLFWVFEGALFVDAGNIWTIHNYENQPGGMFKFNRFYKEIAAAYGLGIRMDFTYFLLRFDLGMKAHNPARGQEEWPIFNPKWGRDATFHFAVGYPF